MYYIELELLMQNCKRVNKTIYNLLCSVYTINMFAFWEPLSVNIDRSTLPVLARVYLMRKTFRGTNKQL